MGHVEEEFVIHICIQLVQIHSAVGIVVPNVHVEESSKERHFEVTLHRVVVKHCVACGVGG